MKLLFIAFLLTNLVDSSYSQSILNKNAIKKLCNYNDIVKSEIVISEFEKNPKKFKYIYNINHELNNEDTLKLYIDKKVCSFISKNYKNIGFKYEEDEYYKIKNILIETYPYTEDVKKCFELDNIGTLEENSCIVGDLNNYILHTTTSTMATTSVSTTRPSTTRRPTTTTTTPSSSTITMNNETSFNTTTSPSNSEKNMNITYDKNSSITQSSTQENNNNELIGIVLGSIFGTIFLSTLLAIFIISKKRKKQNNNNEIQNEDVESKSKDNESIYLEPVACNPEYKTTENGEIVEGVYYPNEPLSVIREETDKQYIEIDKEIGIINKENVYDNKIHVSQLNIQPDE